MRITAFLLWVLLVLTTGVACHRGDREWGEGREIRSSPRSPTAQWFAEDKGLALAAGKLCEQASAADRAGVTGSLDPASVPSGVVLYLQKPVQSKEYEWAGAIGPAGTLAESAENVKILVCVGESKEQVETYTAVGGGGQDAGGAYRIVWDARVLQWPEGRMVAARTFSGGEPPAMATFVKETPFAQPRPQSSVVGGRPSREFGEWLLAAAKNPQPTLFLSGSVFDLAWSPDGKQLAIGGGNGELAVWDVAAGKNVRKFVGHTGNVLSVAFSSDGKLLASGGEDKQVRVWDETTGNEVHTCPGHRDQIVSVAFSPDGRILASAGVDGEGKLWDLAAGCKPRALGGGILGSGVVEVAFLPASQRLVTRDCRRIAVRDVSNGRVLREFCQRRSAEVAAATPSEGSGCSALLDVAITPDGRTAASFEGDGWIKLWDLDTARVRSKFIFQYPMDSSPRERSRSPELLAFAPDGQTLAIGCSEGSVILWDTAQEKTIDVVNAEVESLGLRIWACGMGSSGPYNGDAKRVGSLAFSPDGKTLAVGYGDGTVRLLPTVPALPH